jgi:hypothetical protein
MFFIIKSTSPDSDLAIYRAKRQAKLQLYLFAEGVTEMRISNYLQKTYNITLREACAKILQNANFSMTLDKEILVTIPDKQLNDIAKIITYGPGGFAGSRILKQSLTLK